MEWNSAWTEVGDLNTAKIYFQDSGTSTAAALAFGGDPKPGNYKLTESWNGSSWTEVNDLNTAREHCAGFGTQASALALVVMMDLIQEKQKIGMVLVGQKQDLNG